MVALYVPYVGSQQATYLTILTLEVSKTVKSEALSFRSI